MSGIRLIKGGQAEELPETVQEALRILQEQRECVLGHRRLRAIAVVAVYDPAEDDDDDTASITAADWRVDTGVAPAELLGILFDLGVGISGRGRATK